MPTETQQTNEGEGIEGAELSYAQMNKEVASLMPNDEQIVFGPAEDFEYRAPLEDFQKTLQK